MADVIEENINENMDADSMQEKAKDKIRGNKRNIGIGAGVATIAALVGTGYMIGKKHAESRSTIYRIRNQLGI
jgi:hypothetical protein